MAYSPEDRERIIESVRSAMSVDGISLRQGCARVGVAHSTLLFWIMEDDAAGGTLADQFARARSDLRTLVAEDVISIADDASDDPASRRVRVETRLKVLARLAPKRWGEKTQAEVSGPDGGAIPVVAEVVRKVVKANAPQSGD